jgi:hypothetical protein
MKVTGKHLDQNWLTITYEDEAAPGSTEVKEVSLLLNLSDALDLMYRAGIIDGHDGGTSFFNTTVHIEQDDMSTRKMPLHEVAQALDDADCYKIIKHSEYVSEYQKKGYAQMLADARQESAALKQAIIINREKIKAL